MSDAMTNLDEQTVHDLRSSAAVIRAAAIELRDRADSLPPELLRSLAGMVEERSGRLESLIDEITRRPTPDATEG